MTKREFTQKYEFQNVEKLEDMQNLYSPEEEHFGVKWKTNIRRKNEHLAIYLYTNVIGIQEVHADYTMQMISKNPEKILSKSASNVFEKRINPNGFSWGWHTFIDWKILESEYLDNGLLEVEVHVKVTKMIGFPRRTLRSFGENMQQFSDVILNVKERKFYISKLYLSSHSPYFATLFLGKFQESQKSEIELQDVDPQDFQHYLELLHLGNGIDEDTVQGILSVADMFDTPIVIEKCEEFLIEKSKMELKKKLELAGHYRMETLKNLCLDEIKSKEDIRSVLLEDPREMDHDVVVELLKKALCTLGTNVQLYYEMVRDFYIWQPQVFDLRAANLEDLSFSDLEKTESCFS